MCAQVINKQVPVMLLKLNAMPETTKNKSFVRMRTSCVDERLVNDADEG
jgi:hypothetical protein